MCAYLKVPAGCWQNSSRAAPCQLDKSSPEFRKREMGHILHVYSYQCIPIRFCVCMYVRATCVRACVHLQCVALAALCDLQYERGQHVEPLAVAHGFIPAGVGQQHPLQHHAVLLPLLATVGTAAGPVQVLSADNNRYASIILFVLIPSEFFEINLKNLVSCIS